MTTDDHKGKGECGRRSKRQMNLKKTFDTYNTYTRKPSKRYSELDRQGAMALSYEHVTTGA